MRLARLHKGPLRWGWPLVVGVIGILVAGLGVRNYLDGLARREVLLPPVREPLPFEMVMPATLPAASRSFHAPVEASGRAPAAEMVELPDADGLDVIGGEYILSFADARMADLLAQLARRHGVVVLDRYGNTLRIGARDRQRLSAMLQEVSGVAVEANLRVRIPLLDETGDALPAPAMPYRGFGDETLAWLGVPEPQADWGRGVVVAILDTGIAGVPVTHRMNVTGVDAQGEHGSLVAAILGQMLPGASLMDVQVMQADGTGDVFTVAKGIREAVDAGAQLINMSIGTRGASQVLADAVQYALDKGVLIVASAGNEGVARVSYPAAYDGVLSVAAVDADERHLHFSNRGERVDLAGPGVGVSVAVAGGDSVSFSGTSAAAPFVTATAGLALGMDGELRVADLRRLLVDFANDTGEPGVNGLTGAGIVSPLRVQEKDQPGIVDMAVLRPYFHVLADGATPMITVAAENRGTVDLAAVEMLVSVNDHEYRLAFDAVGRGRTIAHNLDARRYMRADGVLDVVVRIVLPQDIRPENNQLRAVQLPVVP